MNRCTFRLAASVLLAFCAALGGLPAAAQDVGDPPAVRDFPQNALRGQLVVLAPPEISMDGKPDRLAPGARLRDNGNLMLLTGQVINQNLTVNYLRDNMGLVQQVWVLTWPVSSSKLSLLRRRAPGASRSGLPSIEISGGANTTNWPRSAF